MSEKTTIQLEESTRDMLKHLVDEYGFKSYDAMIKRKFQKDYDDMRARQRQRQAQH